MKMGLLEDQAKKLIGEGISQVAGQMAGQVLGGGDLGGIQKIIMMIIEKLKKNYTVPQIAKDVEKPENYVQGIADVVSKVGMDADVEKILESVMKQLPNLMK